MIVIATAGWPKKWAIVKKIVNRIEKPVNCIVFFRVRLMCQSSTRISATNIKYSSRHLVCDVSAWPTKQLYVLLDVDAPPGIIWQWSPFPNHLSDGDLCKKTFKVFDHDFVVHTDFIPVSQLQTHTIFINTNLQCSIFSYRPTLRNFLRWELRW